jgi:hypothetical protein
MAGAGSDRDEGTSSRQIGQMGLFFVHSSMHVTQNLTVRNNELKKRKNQNLPAKN